MVTRNGGEVELRGTNVVLRPERNAAKRPVVGVAVAIADDDVVVPLEDVVAAAVEEVEGVEDVVEEVDVVDSVVVEATEVVPLF
jgi:hypothetical protein